MPNTKTKKFDFQIFLAVFLILLVISCATVCVVFSNDENGVAYAAAVNVENTIVNITDSFYLKDFSSFTIDETKSFIEYISLGVEDFLTSTFDVGVTNYVGTFDVTYNNSYHSLYYLVFDIQKMADYNLIGIGLRIIGLNGTATLFSLIYDSSTFSLASTEVAENDGLSNLAYTFGLQNLKNKSWFTGLFNASGESITSVSAIKFTFNTSCNLSCIISSSTTFVSIPNVGSGNVEELQAEIDRLNAEIERLNGIIETKDKTIDYYEALMPQTETVAVFDISKCVPSTFVYNGVTYSSDTIEAIDGGGWNVYDSRYKDKQLPINQSVGFSLLLTETLNNIKIHINPNIQPWYHYTYCSEPNEQGESQCFDHLVKLSSFSVGYRNQNGQVVKLGEVSPDLVGNTEFIINQPTNEIVFFAPECNRLEIGNGMGVFYYKVNTQVLYDEAYAEGYKTGYGYGKYVGKNEGIEQASDYSFFSLFSAVFDAPITAIVGRWGDSDGDGVYQREGGMLNFYIPGLEINFAPFLLSIFTLAIIVMIIRFILARKS